MEKRLIKQARNERSSLYAKNVEEASKLGRARKECDKKNERLERAKEKLRKKLEEAKKLLA